VAIRLSDPCLLGAASDIGAVRKVPLQLTDGDGRVLKQKRHINTNAHSYNRALTTVSYPLHHFQGDCFVVNKNLFDLGGAGSAETYQDEDVSLALVMEVVGELRQLFEIDLVVREVLLVLHVVYVGVLNVLKAEKRGK